MNATPTDFLAPDKTAMAAHIEHLFGGFLDGYHEGRIELAWTNTTPDAAGKYKLANAELFGTDQIEELVERAAVLNARPMCNIYIGAALRHPHTAPSGRCSDSDAWALPFVYVDLDDEGAAPAAKLAYGADVPTLAVVTGRSPYMRAQLWWRLNTPLTDHAAWEAQLRGIATKLNGDTSVCNPSRVMRLAGSIAWPVKEGRTIERTELIPIKNIKSAYAASDVARLFPPAAATAVGEIDTGRVVRDVDPLGTVGLVRDGREKYMANTVLALLREFLGENGAAPTPQELFDRAWPQYAAKVDFSRPGRTKEEMAQKCRTAIRRFEAGRIKGMETIEAAVASHLAKANDRSAAKSGEPRSDSDTPQRKANALSIRRVIAASPELTGFVGWDEFQLCPMLLHPIPDPDRGAQNAFEPRPWRDSDDVRLALWLQANGFPTCAKNIANDVMQVIAEENAFHPVRDYLDGLTWDGEPRLSDWLRRYGGAVIESAEHLGYVEAVSRAVLVSAVARIYRPGAKVDTMLIMEGPQRYEEHVHLDVVPASRVVLRHGHERLGIQGCAPGAPGAVVCRDAGNRCLSPRRGRNAESLLVDADRPLQAELRTSRDHGAAPVHHDRHDKFRRLPEGRHRQPTLLARQGSGAGPRGAMR